MSEIRLLQAIKKLRDKLLEVEKLAKIQPKNGKDGLDGKDGKDGIDGKSGKDGKDGKPGKDGIDGLGIKDAYIDDEGHLIIVFDNKKEKDCGKVVGKDGKPGKDGLSVKPIHGIGITEVKIIDSYLMVYLTDGKIINAGKVATEAGEVVEKDPVFTKSPAGSITTENINNWNNKVEDNNYVHTDNNFTNELKSQITIDQKRIDNNIEKIAKLDKDKADKTELENSKSVKFETILGENYSLISTTANYEETIQAFENKKMVYSTMVCEGVENGYMYPTEWKTQMDDPYISFVYHFRRGHEINEVWMHIRKSGNNTTEWRILENSQMKRTYETGWQEVPDDEHYVSERLLVDTFNNFQTLGDKVQSIKDYAGSEDKYPSVKASAEYTDSQCGVVLDYMQTTFADNILTLAGLKRPVPIYYNAEGFEASNSNVGDDWHLTGLDLSPYKRLKFYVKSAGSTNDNYTPSHIVEMYLDPNSKSYKDFYVAGHTSQNPNNANRLHNVTFAVNAEKTAVQFARATSLYGTASTASKDGRNCYLIEGYYD